jgi:hypothetical protein
MRPDSLALIGPEYDRVSPRPERRTLLICSAPRTGSTELCRNLLAAGIGIPHEYFNSDFARLLGERWLFGNTPIGIWPRHRRSPSSAITERCVCQFDRLQREDRGSRGGCPAMTHKWPWIRFDGRPLGCSPLSKRESWGFPKSKGQSHSSSRRGTAAVTVLVVQHASSRTGTACEC